jgi:hypothetical protein
MNIFHVGIRRPVFAILVFLVLTRLTQAATDTIQVAVVAEMTPTGQKLVRPTADHPVYCLEMVDEDTASAPDGAHPKGPPNPQFLELATQALKAEGYVLGTNASPPSLFIVFTWGHTRPKRLRRQLINPAMVLPLLGGSGYMGMTTPGSSDSELVVLASHPRYYLIASAYDVAAWQHNKKVQPLWQTHVSTATWNLRFDRALPTLIAAIAPACGREIPSPEFEDTPLAKN